MCLRLVCEAHQWFARCFLRATSLFSRLDDDGDFFFFSFGAIHQSGYYVTSEWLRSGKYRSPLSFTLAETHFGTSKAIVLAIVLAGNALEQRREFGQVESGKCFGLLCLMDTKTFEWTFYVRCERARQKESIGHCKAIRTTTKLWLLLRHNRTDHSQDNNNQAHAYSFGRPQSHRSRVASIESHSERVCSPNFVVVIVEV